MLFESYRGTSKFINSTCYTECREDIKIPNHSKYFIMSMKFDIFFGIIHVTKKKLFGKKFDDTGGQGVAV